MTITSHWDPMNDRLVVTVDCDGERHTRRLDPLDDADVQDLRIAGMYWRHVERAFRLNLKDAALTEQCMAVERLFPHLRERLPA